MLDPCKTPSVENTKLDACDSVSEGCQMEHQPQIDDADISIGITSDRDPDRKTVEVVLARDMVPPAPDLFSSWAHRGEQVEYDPITREPTTAQCYGDRIVCNAVSFSTYGFHSIARAVVVHDDTDVLFGCELDQQVDLDGLNSIVIDGLEVEFNDE